MFHYFQLRNYSQQIPILENEHRNVVNSMKEEKEKVERKFNRKYQNIMNKYGTMCQLLSNKLVSLESLQHEFNKSWIATKHHIKLIEDLSKRIQAIETRASPNRLVFTAYLPSSTPVSPGSVLSNFPNIHPCYTAGRFTAPTNDIYLVSATFHQQQEKLIEISFCTRTRDNQQHVKKSVCLRAANTSVSTTLILSMTVGEELFMRVDKADGGASLSTYTHFTCVRL
ncbi:uncharacterized protein LOC131932114 [Physella acuta]|uniref:uncharacterized protein LOC131932114 n=1 Tax=Physella acuta TaxID=109671 RepID=UPI0027DB50A5|nr:uncharacterized protein LOC131932114 [Physella acuta]